jgi:aminoglycoside phosphotransferase family enzyme/predicted kinase
MATELYETVRSIIADDHTLRFGDADDPKAIDWVVIMRRFRQDDLLEARRKAGILSHADIVALAEAIAQFHMAAQVSTDFGGVAGIRAVVEENVGILRKAESNLCPMVLTEEYAALSETWLRRIRHTLGWRRQTGYVRRCHGDLHLNNVTMIAGKPVLFDAIEFDDSFANIDVFFDLAFILMDLDSHGLRTHANVLLNRYLERTGDYAGLTALPLFMACRAGIRAHVAIAAREARANDGPDKAEPGKLLKSANFYLGARSPELIAVGGLSGTGKTTLARLLAPAMGVAPGAVILRSDVIRKSMLGVAEDVRLGDEAYDAKTNSAVYQRLSELARTALAAGHSVVADAVFGDEAERRHIASVAHETAAEFHGVWLTAPRLVLEQRLASRVADASDATVAVLGRQMARIQDAKDWPKILAQGAPADVLARIDWAIGLGGRIAI